MAHLHDDDENRFTKKVLEGVDAATRVEINKSAGELRKEISSLGTRLDGNEQAILGTVRKIAKRLDALEKTAAENGPTSAKSLEALRLKLRRATGMPDICV